MDEVTLQTAEKPVKILLVDDEELVRAGLRMLLDGTEGLSVVGEAGDGQSALDRVAEQDPDVVLLDIRMPGMNGLTCAQALLAEDPNRVVLILTTFDADETVLHALELGVHGFLLKDTPPGELIAGVKQAAAGHPVLSPSVTRQVIGRATEQRGSRMQDDAVRRLAALTERERDIAVALARGLSNQDIAAELYISLATVKTHVARIFTKLGAANRVQVAQCVYEANLL